MTSRTAFKTPQALAEWYEKETLHCFLTANPHIKQFLPGQQKALQAGLLTGENLLICTPTASGKTLIAELAALPTILEKKKKALYVVPLKALASEKYKELKKKYGKYFKVSVTSGDLDAKDEYLVSADFILATAEKLDSLLRHHVSWIHDVGLLVIDEIHLLHDPGRGPTLEVLIVMLKHLLPELQVLALSATIGNPEELAGWLEATLIEDQWRPVKLEKGVYIEDKILFYEEKSK